MRALLAATLCLAVAAQTRREWVVEHDRMATILFGVSFIDEDTGIVTGGANGAGSAIFYTKNGGRDYELVPAQGQPLPGISMFLSAHLASTNAAAAAGLCSWCFEATGIEYSTDMTRFRLANDPPFGFPPVVGVQGGDRIRGSRNEFAFVGTWGMDALGDETITDVGVRYTPDGGLNWRRIPIAYRSAGVRYMAAPSSTTWYATAGRWTGYELKRDALQLTDKLTIHVDQQMQMKWEHPGLRNAANRTGDNRFSAAVLKTTDGGRTWTTVFERLRQDFYLNNIDCISVDVCWTVAEGDRVLALRTTDAGRTWQEVPLGVTDLGAAVMDIRFISPREGFVAGGVLRQDDFRGFVLHTTDGGATWSRSNIDGVYPVSLSMYLRRDGTVGGHGVGLTEEGQASTIVYR